MRIAGCAEQTASLPGRLGVTKQPATGGSLCGMLRCLRSPVQYRLDPDAGVDGEPAGSSSRAGLAAFLRFVRQVGLERVLRERVRLPVQERRTGFSVAQKSLALLATLAVGCHSAREGDFVLKSDQLAAE